MDNYTPPMIAKVTNYALFDYYLDSKKNKIFSYEATTKLRMQADNDSADKHYSKKMITVFDYLSRRRTTSTPTSSK